MTGDPSRDRSRDRVLLGSWPTPLEPMPRLAAHLGLDPGSLWVKRDDLTGLGGGGNKVRKLERTCARALAAGATRLVTSGAAQSNHARITAAAAARLGLACTLVLEGDERPVTGNLLLDALAGADLVWAGHADHPSALGVAVDEVVVASRERGEQPFAVPYGGTDAHSARAYADAAAELLEQAPDLARTVVAVGSGGTMAGLVAGLGPERVVGVDTGAGPDARATVAGLLEEMGVPVGPTELRLVEDQVGAAYDVIGDPVRRALATTARTEGIFLDPIYTGRAMAALVDLAGAGRGELAEGRTVFWHTGGLPGLLARPDALG